jgi:hypothetical protein
MVGLMFNASPSSRYRPLIGFFVALSLAGCGGSPQAPSQNPPPTPQAPTVTGISPATGSTLGGTNVTITGTNFAAGATVTIGGVAATNVAVQNPTTITATTPQRSSGSGEVVVTVGSLSGRLANGFTFAAPSVTNAPPVITSIIAQDQRRGAPRNFADLEDLVDVSAAIQDAETPASALTYEWTAETGTFEGSGRELRWRAPNSFRTPADVRLNLTVIEKYDGVNDQGLPAPAEHRVAGSVVISLHDSEKELSDLGGEFLTDFSQQRLSPEAIVRNFTDTCRGKGDELSDVQNNQREQTITEYSIGAPQVTISFGAVCQYFSSRGRFGDGCANFPVRWKSTRKSDGRITVSQGFDQVNALFQNGRWQLCDSDFNGTVTVNGVPSNIRFKK